MAGYQHVLDTPIEFLKGVGPVRAELLKKELSIFTFGDLLCHFPFRYLDRTQFTPISQLQPQQQFVQVKGTLGAKQFIGEGRNRRLSAWLHDDSGQLELVWFQGLKWAEKNLTVGATYAAFGRLNFFRGQYSITHPELARLDDGQQASFAGRMQPVYPSTEKLKSRHLDSRGLARLIQTLLEQLKPTDIAEILPSDVLQRHRLLSRYDAFRYIHLPPSEQEGEQARQRFCFEELFLHQVRMARLHRFRHVRQPALMLKRSGDLLQQFYRQNVPFQLTEAQKRVIREIIADMKSGRQMNRLLQGDVGSGKTIVALSAMLAVIGSGGQCALMVPTEVLAYQHFRTITQLTAGLPLRVGLLTASIKGRARQKLLQQLQSGAVHLLVGTHALLEGSVHFHRLGLVVIDEQHRFGVVQRGRLWMHLERPPHVLVMTATPIPRTLALTLYGDLDQSVLDELPPGRQAVVTAHRTDADRLRIFSFLKSQIDQGRQAYVIYPLIEESEKLDFKHLMEGYEAITRAFPLPQYAVSIMHGRMKPDDREYEMQRFVRGETQIMVATTVIEVGVDVPNATVMIIESAERFGLAQLHQLRGRVGRGVHKSYCILITPPRISAEARARISIMTQTNDGFRIAEEDLRLRGPGDLEGTRQSGLMEFRVAHPIRDICWLEKARAEAQRLIAEDPLLQKPQHQALKNFIIKQDQQRGNWIRVS
ncbi:MAG: ATP-dependent DNA helicase RecG [Chitinophagales bacterium]|nr:ATP-dependent DNA helicase RecG [Chitinophagales bacterium]MDW8428818.1 ATP-dependent DNA helicase RecG [Chitinophagales bacterium]